MPGSNILGGCAGGNIDTPIDVETLTITITVNTSVQTCYFPVPDVSGTGYGTATFVLNRNHSITGELSANEFRIISPASCCSDHQCLVSFEISSITSAVNVFTDSCVPSGCTHSGNFSPTLSAFLDTCPPFSLVFTLGMNDPQFCISTNAFNVMNGSTTDAITSISDIAGTHTISGSDDTGSQAWDFTVDIIFS